MTELIRNLLLGVVAGAGLLGWTVIGPLPGILLAVAAAVTLRAPRARPLLTIGGPAVFAYSVLWMMLRQHTKQFPSGFEWPTYFDSIQQVAWLAVALLLLDAAALVRAAPADLVARLFHFFECHGRQTAAGCEKGRFIDQVGEFRTGESGRTLGNLREVDIGS